MDQFPVTLAVKCPRCGGQGSLTISTTGHPYIPELYVSAKSKNFDGSVTKSGMPIALCLKCMVTADINGGGSLTPAGELRR